VRANILATFERQSSPLDHFIGEVEAWEVVTRAFVYLEPQRGQERQQEQQTQAHATHWLRTVWTPDVASVNTACRVRATTTAGAEKTYQIEEIQNIREQNRELRFVCVEAA